MTAPTTTATRPEPATRLRAGARLAEVSWLPSAVAIVALLVVWEVLALTVMADSKAFPPFTDVVGNVVGDLDTYTRNLRSTLRAVWPGWLYGNIVATFIGVVAIAIPHLERPALHVAVAISSLPIIALGPIFQVSLTGDAPRSALAALSVFLTTMIGAMVGLRACDKTSLDMVRAFGGGPVSALRKVRLRAALPDYFAALRISAPAAILGGIIGEFIGGADNGLGVALIAARANADPARVWGLALVATLAAGAGYALIALVGRLLTPWAPRGRETRR
ncbi:MAG TPA: ABC transporter permease subunit [Iamia sp.]|jgi:ABC-type nitrate/sulfonate/bicarbonate transport system permease component|nr:ABC transporter permease subunit [Iamia sp.]